MKVQPGSPAANFDVSWQNAVRVAASTVTNAEIQSIHLNDCPSTIRADELLTRGRSEYADADVCTGGGMYITITERKSSYASRPCGDLVTIKRSVSPEAQIGHSFLLGYTVRLTVMAAKIRS